MRYEENYKSNVELIEIKQKSFSFSTCTCIFKKEIKMHEAYQVSSLLQLTYQVESIAAYGKFIKKETIKN